MYQDGDPCSVIIYVSKKTIQIYFKYGVIYLSISSKCLLVGNLLSLTPDTVAAETFSLALVFLNTQNLIEKSLYMITGTCKFDEFTCDNGECIPLIYKCDTLDDCADSSDELYCNDTGSCKLLK